MENQGCAKTVAKAFICVGVFAIASLSLLYTFQDKMLYLPTVPIRHSNDNIEGYRSPKERKIQYQDT